MAGGRLRLALARAARTSACLAITAAPHGVWAQEIKLEGPLACGACPAVLVREATPARLEWSYWMAGGAILRPTGAWGATGGLGADLTASALTYRGFPASPEDGKNRGRGEVRVGVWSAASTRGEGGLVEGGSVFHWGAVYHARGGAFDLRVGGGYGTFDGRRPHRTVTLTYGVRSVVARYSERGFCDPAPKPRSLAMASVARLFATHRRAHGVTWGETVFGIELSPTFFLPPYGWGRLAGGWPWGTPF